MYSLYLLECEQKCIPPVSLAIYRHVFNTHFNISFHKPIKDQCDLCNSYKNASSSDEQNMKEKYENLIENNTMCRLQKDRDKKMAQEGTITTACFDLEQVLLTPKAFEYSLYYKRRLNTFNFSIYNLGTTNDNCYIWNETISGLGACEIASCVYDFLQEMSKKGQKKFVFYLDICSAQNKNR